MVDGVDASDRVKPRVRKRQWLRGVGNPEGRLSRQAALDRERAGRRNGLLMHVDADDRTTAAVRDSQHRAAGSTRHIEKSLAVREVEPGHEPVLLVRREPA